MSNSVSTKSSQLKLYKFFMLCVPIFFTFLLLVLFYLFYLRPRRVNTSWQNYDDISRTEMGLKKELREMLPIIVYKESFFVRDSQCAVCLGEYEAEDRLQQIPACGHTFHIDCIDHWLSNHTTCPLCRLSLLPLPNSQGSPPVPVSDNNSEPSRSLSCEGSDELRSIDTGALHNAAKEDTAASTPLSY
ncbi:hypothetical protein UlMin_043046 [Ulmus minor]